MALSDDVQNRVPEQLLVELTNERDRTATAINTTKLAQAASSVEAWFALYAQEAYDATVAIHLEVAVVGVMGLLRAWADGDYEGNDARARLREECERVKATRSRARVKPTTNSDLTPADPNPTGVQLRPWSDIGLMQDVHIERPGGGN